LDLCFPDTLDLLGEFDLDRYRLQRRLIGPLYQTRSLLKHETAIDEVLYHSIARLKSLNGESVDLKEWMHIITVECLTAVVLSWSPGYLRDGTDHGVGPHAYLGWRRKSVFGLFPWAEVTDAYSRTLGRTFARAWRLTYQPPSNYKALFPMLGTKVSKRINAALRPVPAKDNRNDLTAELIQLHKGKPEFTTDYLKRMIMTNFGAGHETTTSTLISVLTMLGIHPHFQARVAAEVSSHVSCTSTAVSYAATLHMTYTQAAIKESQRLHPVIGMSLSRRVPSTGLHVHDQYFPPGTTVGCNPIALHRNPDIFGPDSESFNPDRWLDGSRIQDMERYNLIWGGGQRTCPGQSLAKLIVYKVVATLMREFKIEVEVPPEDEMRIYFMAILTGVKVKFVERRD
jgi:cytochrome P450